MITYSTHADHRQKVCADALATACILKGALRSRAKCTTIKRVGT
jgi:hypothetical protein